MSGKIEVGHPLIIGYNIYTIFIHIQKSISPTQ